MQETGSHAGGGRHVSLRLSRPRTYLAGMHLSEIALQEFRELYRREVGEELTDAEALEGAQRVVSLIQLLVRMSEDDERNREGQILTE